MPLRFISNLVSSLLRRPNSVRHDAVSDKGSGPTSPSAASVAFSSTITIQGFFSKKTDDHGDTPVLSSDEWSKDPGQMHYWLSQSPIFDASHASSFEDYSLGPTLGTGTFGRVFLARKKKEPAQSFAIKVLNKHDIVKLKQIEHINSERLVLSQVNFPFIVQMHTTFQDHQNLYMVQEFVLGGELFRHLRKVGRFTNEMARFYAAEIILALEYLHSKDMIYRDLKPENLLLDCHGHIKITDFGFAKIVTDRTWTLCGTPEYLAPEIIQSKGHGKAVDWWSLGILIFEMLAGYPPFYDDSHFGIYERILAGKITYPNLTSRDAKDLIKKLLVTDRTRRLGNLKGGVDDIKQHKWLRNTDWQGLLTKTVKAPFIPSYTSLDDTSNFESYPPEQLTPSQDNDDTYYHLFPDF